MRFLIYCKSLFIFIIFISLFSCDHSPKSKMFVHDSVDWNYLVYMAADNNLERFAINNIKALQLVGSPDNANILVLLDRSPSYDRTEGNWSGTKLLYISSNPKNMNDDVIYDYGELDMTDSNNLYKFLKTANKYFPSNHTVLNIWSHGRGVYPDGIVSKGVIEDYSTGYGAANTMAVVDFASAIEKYETEDNKKIDIIQFDSCDMQMIEVCYQLKGLVDYVTGAETQIPGSGSDYKSIAEYLKSNNFTSEELSKYIASSFYEYQKNSYVPFSYSVVKTDKLNEFINSFNSLCDNLLILSDEKLNSIVSKRGDLLKTDTAYPEFCDLLELLNVFNEEEIDISVVREKFEECNILSKSLGDFIDKAKGLGINFPYTQEEINYYKKSGSSYKLLDFYTDSKFDEFLMKIWNLV